MKRIASCAVLALLPLALGCDLLTGPDAGHRIFVRPPDLLVIQNRDHDEALFSMVIAEDASPLIDWAPCISEDGCGYVAPGGERRLQVEDIPGADFDEYVLAYTWRTAMGPGDGAVPGPVSVKRLRLPRPFDRAP